MRRWLRRAALLVRKTEGASAVEFALAFPVLIAVMAGMFDFGRYYWVRNSMQLATEETGRYVMITGTTSSTTVQTYLRGKVDAVPSAQVSVNATPSTSGGVNYLTITATYNFSSIFGDWMRLCWRSETSSMTSESSVVAAMWASASAGIRS